MYAYCLFCETARCGHVAQTAMQIMDCTAISPKQMQHTRHNGKMTDIEHDLLPGYVFIYRKSEPLDVYAAESIRGVIRCLCTPDGVYELRGNDERFAVMLLHCGGVIGKTRVYEEGNRIRVCQGAYEGLESRILKIDRHKRRMQIELPFANTVIRTWVEFEITEDPEMTSSRAKTGRLC